MESPATGFADHLPFDTLNSSVYSTLVPSPPSLPVLETPGRRRRMARGKATRSGTSSQEEVRSRTFTGCRTCRSRHLKCDEARPICSSCRRLNLPCEGYAARLLWVSEQASSSAEKQAHRGSSYRYLLFTESARNSMSSELIDSLGTQSAGDVLHDIDAEVVQAGQSHGVGPFGVFRAFDSVSVQEAASPEDDAGWFTQPVAAIIDGSNDSCLVEDNVEGIRPSRPWVDNDTLDTGIFSDSYVELPSSSTISSLNQPWMDLESIGDSFQMLSCDTPGMDFLFPPLRSPCQQDSINETHDYPTEKRFDSRSTCPSRAEFTTDVSDPSTLFPRMSSHISGGGDPMLPPHAVPLLRYYKDHALDSSIFSQGMKVSPWKLFALPCALETFAELSLWNHTSHTRLSILYTIMAKSVFHLNRYNKGHKQTSGISLHMAFDFQKAAQEHLKSALREEVGQITVDGGSTSENTESSMNQGKYVEVLTAVLSLSVISVFLHGSRIVKPFLMDAERLIRLHGLRSQATVNNRILHHMYTHLRILSESTDVSTEMENQGSGTRVPAHSVGKAVVLRKFRVAKDCLGSDLDLSREKTAEIGYGDIHLEISGHWPATLYPEIYGIPESLLTFLSQTISIANEKAKLEVMAVNDGSISSALSRHIRTLEQNIWQWSLEKNELPIGPTRPNNLIDADAALISQPHARSVALALHQALIIYFYRRVYNMSAMVVQDSVRKTVEFLQPCLADDADTHNFATTIAWCSFVAACEATSASLQQDSIKCLEAVAERAGMFGADNPCEVVKSVWQQRAESGGWALSWPDVLNQRIG